MKSLPYILLIALFLTACTPATPSASLIETAIAQTQAAQPSTSVPATPTPAPTVCISKEFHTQLLDILSRFNDATTLADNTPRMQLADGIADLQAIRRDALALEFPACATQAQPPLIGFMDATINGFTEFLAENPYDTYFEEANLGRETFQRTYDEIRKTDQLTTGDISPIDASILQLTPLEPDGHQFYFTLENTAAQPVWFLNLAFQYSNEDGTTWTLAEQYVSAIAPGDTIHIAIARTSEMVNKKVDYTKITFSLLEGYTTAP